MIYQSDDIVVTKDGKEHRVLWECRGGGELYVKSAAKRCKGYKVKTANVVEHRKRERKL